MAILNGYIRAKLDKFRDKVADNAINSIINTSPVGLINRVTQIPQVQQQIPQIKTQINKIPNIQLRPNAPTLGQAAKNAIRSPLDFPMQLTTRPKTGNKFMDLTNEYVTNTGGQALKNVMNLGSLGLINTQAAKPTNIVQRAGGFAGGTAGIIAAIGGPVGIGLTEAGLGGEAVVRGILPQATPRLIARVAPVLGGEATQTGVIAAAKKGLNQDFNPLTDFAAGVGLRAAGPVTQGALKKIVPAFAKNQYKYIEPGDKADILKKVESLLMRGGEADYDIRFRAKDEKFLRQMAEDYVNKSFAKKASIQDIAQELINRIRGEDNMELMDLPTMGLVGKGQAKLKNLMTYDRDLKAAGYLPSQIEQISAPEAKRILENNIPPFEHPTFPKDIGPATKPTTDTPQYTKEDINFEGGRAQMNADMKKDVFDNVFKKWVGKREAARTTGTQVGAKFKSISAKEGPEVIRAMESPELTNISPSAKRYVEPLHQEFDRLYNEAQKAGIDIGYRENYITHYWNKEQKDVEQLYQVFKQREGFQNERKLPTYEEGIRMGLKPKFTNPAQIITQYASSLERLKANLEFLGEAKKEGLIVDAVVGRSQPGFVAINAPGFPRSVSRGPEGTQYIGDYYAPVKVAEKINKLFSPQKAPKVLRAGQFLSSKAQDIMLSGGIPATPVNAFTLAQVQKEVLSTRFISPLKSLVRSMSESSSNRFFEENAEQIKKMQVNNIPISTSYDIENLIDRNIVKKVFGNSWGDIWGKIVNDPTFKRFMPQLQIRMFNDIEKQVLESGKTPEEATAIAAKAVKNFYGLTDTADQLTKSETWEAVKTSSLLARKFRESMINFWINNGRALRHPLRVENRANVKFLGMSLLTLGAMNFLNEQLNGHGMLDNPPGKEDKLLIPLEDGTVIGVPFLPSIATVPRAVFRQGKMALTGDISGAGKDALQTYGSVILKPLADVIANQDYFGKPIVDETDLPGEKLTKQAKYVGKQFLGHPYLKELATGRGDPAYQRISRAVELPFRFYNQESLAKSTFYDKYYELKPLADQIEELSYKDPGKAEELKAKNADKLDQFYYMKELQKAYYDGADQGKGDSSLLQVGAMPDGTTRAGNRIIYRDDEGKWDNINLAYEPVKPRLTGSALIDKKLISTYKGQLTKKENSVIKLFELGAINQKEAEGQLAKIDDIRDSLKGSKKPKKLSVKVGKAQVGKIRVPKAKKVRLKALKIENPKPRRVKYHQLKSYSLSTKKNPLV